MIKERVSKNVRFIVFLLQCANKQVLNTKLYSGGDVQFYADSYCLGYPALKPG